MTFGDLGRCAVAAAMLMTSVSAATAQSGSPHFDPKPISLTGKIKTLTNSSAPTLTLLTPNIGPDGKPMSGVTTTWDVLTITPNRILSATNAAGFEGKLREITVTILGYRSTEQCHPKFGCTFAARQLVVSDTCTIFIGRTNETAPYGMRELANMPKNDGLDVTRC